MEPRRFIPLLLVLAGLAAYHNTVRAPFIFDDYNAVVDNPHVRALWPPWEAMIAPPQSTVAGRPVAALTLALNYAVSGLNPWSYHAFNLAVHLANALLLFGIARRTLERMGRVAGEATGLALAIALVWMAHPLLTESVTYISQRTELLMAFFFLLTLDCVIRGRQFGAVVACALGMGCKEVMAVAPVVVWLYDRTFLAGSFREALRQRGKLYAALVATWLVLAASIAGGARDATVGIGFESVTPLRYALTQCGVILHYLRLSVWPDPLVLDYDDWPVVRNFMEAAPAVLVVIALLAVTAWALWRKPQLGFLGGCFFLILAPSSSFVPIVTEVAAERRMYLPLVAVVAMAMIAGKRLTRSRSTHVRMVMLGVVVIALGLLTVRRNHDYRSQVAIWSDAVVKRPHNTRALINLGTILAKLGQTDDALARYSEALRVDPDNADAHFSLGVTLAGRGEVDAGLAHLKEAVRLVPDSAFAQYNLGAVLAQKGDLIAAGMPLAESLRLNPRNAQAQNELGVVLARQGRVEDALPYFQEAVRLNPGYEAARRHLATALAQLGRTNEVSPGIVEPQLP